MDGGCDGGGGSGGGCDGGGDGDGGYDGGGGGGDGGCDGGGVEVEHTHSLITPMNNRGGGMSAEAETEVGQRKFKIYHSHIGSDQRPRSCSSLSFRDLRLNYTTCVSLVAFFIWRKRLRGRMPFAGLSTTFRLMI